MPITSRFSSPRENLVPCNAILIGWGLAAFYSSTLYRFKPSSDRSSKLRCWNPSLCSAPVSATKIRPCEISSWHHRVLRANVEGRPVNLERCLCLPGSKEKERT